MNYATNGISGVNGNRDMASGGDPELDLILRRIEQIHSVIEDEADDNARDVELQLPVDALLAALPGEVLESRAAATDGNAMAAVKIPSLMQQLASGRVVVPLRELCAALPAELLAADVGPESEAEAVLPLSLVVRAMQPDTFSKAGRQRERDPDVYSMPDLFSPRDDAPLAADRPEPTADDDAIAPDETVESGAALPGGADEPGKDVSATGSRPPAIRPDTGEPARSVPGAAAAGDIASGRVPDPVAETVCPVIVNGVDLNSADARILAKSLWGVGPAMAQRIIAGRPYRSPYQLAAVRGIGRRLFRRITGLHLPFGTLDEEKVDRIFGSVGGGEDSLPEVVRRIAALSGIRGCLLSDKDGQLLASSWKSSRRMNSVETVAPQIFGQIEKYFELLKMDGPDSVTFYADPYPVFVKNCGDLFLVAAIARSRLTINRIEFLNAIAEEMVRRMISPNNSR